ncbi:PleD family two-component system response regulator [Loktanella sp. DSM 29012]|uniref:response regulator n=1 Tax=Loktanella sp. DSM 29012 TaxID=1881056 RepID=UPI000B7FAC39|nr:response regulator [Loktanella sp. DSM 29012]
METSMFQEEVSTRCKGNYQMKILVVDDEPVLIDFLTMALGALGFENVASARSATEALAMMKSAKDPFGCLLLDIQMPEMDGVALCAEIRKNQVYAKTPIIMLTAMSDRKYIETAFSAGANDYITKPFQIDDLMNRIDSAARLSQQIISADRLVRQIASACQRQSGPFRLQFEDPVSFENTPGYLDQPTFRNFIDRMERSQFRHGGVVSVKVSNASDLYENVSSQEFVAVLTRMSSVVSTALVGENCHFTYAGSGCFLVIKTTADNARFPNEVAFRVKKEMSRQGLRHGSAGLNTIEIAIGRVFRSPAGDFGSIDESLARARERTQVLCA